MVTLDSVSEVGLIFAIGVIFIVTRLFTELNDSRQKFKSLFKNRESLTIVDFYNQYFLGSDTPFYLVEYIFTLLSERLNKDLSSLSADDEFLQDFRLLWDSTRYNFQPGGYIPIPCFRETLEEKFSIVFSYNETFNLGSFRDVVNLLLTRIPKPILTIIFIDDENSSNSILSEALLNYLSFGRFQAFSAGCNPKEPINTHTLNTLTSNGLPNGGYRCKPLNEFAGRKIDLLITINDLAECDSIFTIFKDTPRITWNLPDLSQVSGTEEQISLSYESAYATLNKNIKFMLTMPIEDMNPDELTKAFKRFEEEM